MFPSLVLLYFFLVLPQLKKENKGISVLLTSSQELWVELQSVLLRFGPVRRPPRPKSAVARAAFDIVQHPWFDPVIMATIVLTVFVMACRHAYESSRWQLFQFTCNIIFTCVFTIEAGLKNAAFHPRHYFGDPQNQCVHAWRMRAI